MLFRLSETLESEYTKEKEIWQPTFFPQIITKKGYSVNFPNHAVPEKKKLFQTVIFLNLRTDGNVID